MDAVDRRGSLSEAETVYFNRLNEALRFGLSYEAARDFASSLVDVAMLRRRLKGCDPETAARILRPLDADD